MAAQLLTDINMVMQSQLLAAPSRPSSGELLGAGRVQGRENIPQLPEAPRERCRHVGRHQTVEREAGGAGGEKDAYERRSPPAPDHGVLNGFLAIWLLLLVCF